MSHREDLNLRLPHYENSVLLTMIQSRIFNNIFRYGYLTILYIFMYFGDFPQNQECNVLLNLLYDLLPG